MYRIGIDLGGTGITVGFVDAEYRIAGTAFTPTRTQLGPEQLLDDIAQCVNNGMLFCGIEPEECAGIGIGAPGSCDRAAGTVRHAPNLGWHGLPLRDALERRLHRPVFLANDADCAALGEALAGAAVGCDSALMITLGTGVGGGYVVQGAIHAGFRELGGEFGHMCIQMDGEPCACGQRGCWEAYAGAAALVRQAAAAAAASPDSALNRMELNGRTIYAAAAAGDAAAMAVTARYADYVGVGLVNLINALHPETVLLGGGISGAGNALLEPVSRYVRSHAFLREPDCLPVLRLAALGSNAGVIGAAALVDYGEF